MSKSSGTFQRGIVKYFLAESDSGFIQPIEEADEVNNLHFRITNCDIQTPPPRVGEVVQFELREGCSRPTVLKVCRKASTRKTPAPAPPLPRHAEERATKSSSTSLQPSSNRVAGRPQRNTSRDVSSISIHQEVAIKQRLLAQAPSYYAGGSTPRDVYVDLDHVWVSYVRANHLVERFPGAQTTRDLEINLQGLTRRLAQGEAGSTLTRLVAFYYNTPEAVATRLRSMSYAGVNWEVRKQETATDASMQLELLNAKLPCATLSKTLVLVTGNCSVAPNGMSFRLIMDLYVHEGWFIEVHAWLFTAATTYIDCQRANPRNVVFRPFDDDEVGEILRSRQPQGNRVNNRRFRRERKSQLPMNPRCTNTGDIDRNPPTRDLTNDEPKQDIADAHSSARVKRESSTRFAYSPRDFLEAIQRIGEPGGTAYVSQALAMLRRAGAHTAADIIEDLGVETQRVLLTMQLEEAMDAATMLQLREQHKESAQW